LKLIQSTREAWLRKEKFSWSGLSVLFLAYYNKLSFALCANKFSLIVSSLCFVFACCYE